MKILNLKHAVHCAFLDFYGKPFPEGAACDQKTLLPSNRVDHGIMHGRACMELIPKVHNLYKKYVANYDESFTSIATALEIDTDILIKLIQIAALFHDSARQNDGEDKWDSESADNCYDYLVSTAVGCSRDVALLISNSIRFKDHPQQFIDNIPKVFKDQETSGFKYIQQLVNMADTIEVIRDRNMFDCNYLPLKHEALTSGQSEQSKRDDLQTLVNQQLTIIQQEQREFWWQGQRTFYYDGVSTALDKPLTDIQQVQTPEQRQAHDFFSKASLLSNYDLNVDTVQPPSHSFTSEEIAQWLYSGKSISNLSISNFKGFPLFYSGRDASKTSPKITTNEVQTISDSGPILNRIAICSSGITDIRVPEGKTGAVATSNNGDLKTACGFAIASLITNAAGPGFQTEIYNRFGVPAVMSPSVYGTAKYLSTEGRGYAIHCGSHDLKASHNIDTIEMLTVPMYERDGVINMYYEAFVHNRNKDYIILPMAGMTHPVLGGDGYTPAQNATLSAQLSIEAFKRFVKNYPDSRLQVIFSIFQNPEAEETYRLEAQRINQEMLTKNPSTSFSSSSSTLSVVPTSSSPVKSHNPKFEQPTSNSSLSSPDLKEKDNPNTILPFHHKYPKIFGALLGGAIVLGGALIVGAVLTGLGIPILGAISGVLNTGFILSSIVTGSVAGLAIAVGAMVGAKIGAVLNSGKKDAVLLREKQDDLIALPKKSAKTSYSTTLGPLLGVDKRPPQKDIDPQRDKTPRVLKNEKTSRPVDEESSSSLTRSVR